MSTNFKQNGDSLSVTAGAAYSSGDVVVAAETIGVAINHIASGAVGLIAVTGVYNVPKVSGAVIAAGEGVYYDISAAAFDDNLATAATGDITGACTAWEGAGSGVTTIAVKLNTAIGTVT